MLKNKGRKAVCMILAIVLIMTMTCPLSAFAESGQVISVSDEASLVQAISDAAPGETIQLQSDIELSKSLEVPTGKEITLAGKTGSEKLTISLSSSAYKSAQKSYTTALMSVQGTLTMEKMTVDAGGNLRVMYIGSGGNVTLGSGATVTGGTLGKESINRGAGICLEGSRAQKARLVINDGAVISNNIAYGAADITGIGICCYRYADVVMNGGTISGNKDLTQGTSRYFSTGGGIALEGTGVSLVINGGEISDNYAKASGGGVHVASGNESFIMNGGTIKNNGTAAHGAGVYISGASATMNGGVISGNLAESDTNHGKYASGGGVYIDGTSGTDGTTGSPGVFTLKNGTISGNTAKSTAKADSYEEQFGQGGGVMVLGSFQMEGGVIAGNSALSEAGLSGDIACGGGVSVKGGPYSGTFVMTGGTIKENEADNRGGAIYINNRDLEDNLRYPSSENNVASPGSGTFSIKGEVHISGNTGASGEADNVYLTEDSVLSFSGELDESAEIYVGSEIARQGTVVGKAEDGYTVTAVDARKLRDNSGKQVYGIKDGNVIFTGTAAEQYEDISGADISGVADSYVYTGRQINPIPNVELNGKTLAQGTDYTVSYNTSGYDNTNVSSGGKTAVVKITGAGSYEGVITKTFAITPKNIEEVWIDEITERIYTGKAITPAIKANLNGISLTEGTDYTVSYSANTDPGTATALISGTNNYTGTISKSFHIISGEGLNLITSSQELVKAINASEGTRQEPESLYVTQDMEVSESVEIPSGTYIRLIGSGDNISITSAAAMENLISVEGELITENITLDANAKGRVMLIGAGGKVNISSNTVITGGLFGNGANDATSSGGGIYNSGTLEMTSGEIRSNQAKNGGAIFNAGTLTASNISIYDNTALMGGGGIYNQGTATLNEGSSVSENAAKTEAGYTVGISGAGGGIYNSGQLVCEEGCMIENNTAARYGGGIYTEKDTRIQGGTIKGNQTSGNSQIRVANCGGGVYVAAGKLQMDSGSIQENTAKSIYVTKTPEGSLGNGGGVYVSNNGEDGAEFVMNGGSISNNKASSLTNSDYTGNGGGVFVLGGENSQTESNRTKPGSFSMNGGDITANAASGKGSGVYMSNKEAYTLSNNKTTYQYYGLSSFAMKGEAFISGNDGDNVYLADDEVISLQDTIAGSSIGISAEKKGTAVVAEGSDYTPSAKDAECVTGDTGLRTIALNSKNQIVLQAVDLSEGFSAQFQESSYTYTGKAITPTVQVLSADGKALTEGQDYTVEYEGTGQAGKQLICAGTKEAIVTGTGDYTGTITASYKILPQEISKATATIKDQTYTGKALTPNLASIQCNGEDLLKGTDYKVTYENNVNAGTATATITGQGNYTGTKPISFKIYKLISKTTVAAIGAKAYTGKALTPAPTVKYGTSKLKKGTDYTLSYKNNKTTGKATVVITGKGVYKGTKSVSFNIVPKKATVKTVKSKKTGQLTATCKKDTKASGYQFITAYNSKFTKGKKTVTLKKNTKVTTTFKKLKSKKKYYVKVRAYKTISGKKCYGAYSKVKSVKVK
ncbi:hypothetical protein LI177_03815 [bacterium 210820-DFI.6.37]|nr:hypothetical protein [bacterium 210820-DFI.6.37]